MRVRVCHLESTTVKMLTIKPDLHYCAWVGSVVLVYCVRTGPTWELRLDACKGEWDRILVAGV